MSVIAWRCWIAERKKGGYLSPYRQETWGRLPPNLMYSIFIPFAWTGPTVRQTSSIGLHSLKKEYLHPLFLGNHPTPDFIIGKVELTGQSTEHKGGWISEQQTVVELHVPSTEYVKRYEELYQCDVFLLDDLWDFFVDDDEAFELRKAQLKEQGWDDPVDKKRLLHHWGKKGCQNEYRKTLTRDFS